MIRLRIEEPNQLGIYIYGCIIYSNDYWIILVCMYVYIYTYIYIHIHLFIYIYIPIVIAIKDTTIYRYLADSYMVDMYIYMIYGYNLFCGIYTINELVHLRNQFHRLYCRISCIRHISTIDRHSLVTGLSYSVKCISIWE